MPQDQTEVRLDDKNPFSPSGRKACPQTSTALQENWGRSLILRFPIGVDRLI